MTPEQKIRSCKALQGKTVFDVCAMPGFTDNLAAYVRVQREEKLKVLDFAARVGGGKMHAPRHPIDQTMDWSVERWVVEFLAVVDGTSKRPASLRQYIRQLGMQAYNVTVANIVILEYPELREYFFPKSKVV